MAPSSSSRAAALCLLALMAVCACQVALARALPAEAAAAAPAPAAEDGSLAPAPAPVLDLSVDDGSALLGSNREDAECDYGFICECGLDEGTTGCDQRCEQIATKFAYDVWRKIYLEDCKQRCFVAWDLCTRIG
ncbi:PTS beta-glucoside transporter subunit EIIBCA [Chlorella sorokiniana]|uniref:PTS beta-glucoside transporter subunit EIIBCA n=1 Tax=Chlorella sorokiniana TaxID=3076 RepID=A0A2P6TW96_CHLSO|nr:PTS beta-glucoside transporter subunit EIIBCA [Chlorella sorokiniana]|eukprot:PRW58333.1 PTS beta-glucoside transporter subunit EIIBCA [Chlorella sorokiniana]